MILYINTTQNNFIKIGLKDKNNFIAVKKFKSPRAQTEKLLPAIEKLLKVNKFKLSNLKKIEVENSGGSFTSLRIGVVTANALAYALKILVTANDGLSKIIKNGQRNFKVIEPIYDREPDITIKKRVMNNS